MRILIPLLFLASCTFNPELGMTEDQLRHHHFMSAAAGNPLTLVAAQDSVRVYESDNVFYYFVDGALQRIDQGERFEERIRVTLDQSNQ